MRDTYFLDNMSSSHHIFLMRNLIDVHNHCKNIRAIDEIRRRSKMNVSTDEHGRLFTTMLVPGKVPCTSTYDYNDYS